VFPEQYVWLIWSLMFLIPWIALYIAYPGHRKAMLWAGVFTTPFGLTEPIFVPEYWSPPSLFDLARTTGFDLESLLFCFGIGGTAAVLYNLIARSKAAPMPVSARTIARHRYHYASLATPFVLFPLIYFFPWNPIYPGIVAMAVGAFVTALCRPDLKFKIWIGGLVFTAYYLLFLWGLEWMAPGYIGRVWNLQALSGIDILSAPLEELLFAFAFGAYWSGVYEHFTWQECLPSPRDAF
jgi:hypothetical protein